MARALTPTTRPASKRRGFERRTERRVLDYIRANKVLTAGESIILAVSGGPDSTALLLILHRLAEILDISLTVAHFNHRLRGPDESAGDLEYVTALATRLDLPLVHGSGDVRSRSRKRGESIEDAARSLRYAFLAREAKKASAEAVVTGHNLNDQAETVLLHIARGAGIDGLAGMRTRSSWPFGKGPDLARPLLCLSREVIDRYCRDAGHQPRRDATNEQLTAGRNRIRLRVLPELNALNPRIAEALVRLASSATADADYLGAVARETLGALATGERRHVVLRRGDLRALPTAIASRVIRAAIERVAGTSADVEVIHVEAVLALVDRRPGKLSLPTVSVESDSGSIHIYHAPPTTPPRVPETTLSVPGVTRAGPWTIHCQLIPSPESLAPPSPLECYFNHRLVASNLTVRARRPGDRLHPLSLAGEKKLQDILVDAKVPARERDGVPLICDETGILWVVGHRIDQRARVSPGDRKVLHITATREI